METAAQVSTIITAVIAIIASVIGVIWWYSVRQRRSKREREVEAILKETSNGLFKISGKVMEFLNRKDAPQSEKRELQMILMDQRIARIDLLLHLHFIQSNFRPHEVPDWVKQWKFKSPVQWPMERHYEERPSSRQEQ